jgi:hypothetical protein
VDYSTESWTLFAFYDQTTLSWKTSQRCAGRTEDSEKFSRTWPKQGMTRDGQAFEPATSVPHTAENGSSCSHIPADTEFGDTPDTFTSPTATNSLRGRGANIAFPTPEVSDAYRTGCDPGQRKRTGRQVNLRDVATLFPALTSRPMTKTGRVHTLPTPTASEAIKGSPNSRDSAGRPGLTAAVIELLPTPLAGSNRKSRPAILRHRCGPGLEQVIEMVLGTMPPELTSWQEAPRSWTGVRMKRRSDGGS